MIKTLEQHGLIRRQLGVARLIQPLVLMTLVRA